MLLYNILTVLEAKVCWTVKKSEIFLIKPFCQGSPYIQTFPTVQSECSVGTVIGFPCTALQPWVDLAEQPLENLQLLFGSFFSLAAFAALHIRLK